jgi:hypothetical protein
MPANCAPAPGHHLKRWQLWHAAAAAAASGLLHGALLQPPGADAAAVRGLQFHRQLQGQQQNMFLTKNQQDELQCV